MWNQVPGHDTQTLQRVAEPDLDQGERDARETGLFHGALRQDGGHRGDKCVVQVLNAPF